MTFERPALVCPVWRLCVRRTGAACAEGRGPEVGAGLRAELPLPGLEETRPHHLAGNRLQQMHSPACCGIWRKFFRENTSFCFIMQHTLAFKNTVHSLTSCVFHGPSGLPSGLGSVVCSSVQRTRARWSRSWPRAQRAASLGRKTRLQCASTENGGRPAGRPWGRVPAAMAGERRWHEVVGVGREFRRIRVSFPHGVS